MIGKLDANNYEYIILHGKDGRTVMFIPRNSSVTLEDIDNLNAIFEIKRVGKEGIWLEVVKDGGFR